jgi:YD repeat-containing protein
MVEYDARDDVIALTYFDEQGHPIRHQGGNGNWTAQYDAEGNRTELTFFEPFGEVDKNGVARLRMKYDERGNATEKAFFGVDGALITTILGYATATTTYDEQGTVQSCSYADAKGQPVKPKGKLVVSQVLDNSQAQRLGLQIGDVITGYNQMPINAHCELLVAVAAPGTGPRTLIVMRAGQALMFQVQPGRLGVGLEEVAAPASLSTNNALTVPKPTAP